jgi:hypothetical protein
MKIKLLLEIWKSLQERERITFCKRQQILEPKPPEECRNPWPPQTAQEVHELFIQEDR